MTNNALNNLSNEIINEKQISLTPLSTNSVLNYVNAEIDALNKDQKHSRKKVRSIMIFSELIPPLIEFIRYGDKYQIKNVMEAAPLYKHASGINVSRVINKEPLLDITLVDFIKFISTCFGYSYQEEAKIIYEAMMKNKVRKRIFHFRCGHSLYLYGSPEYQNICLISGMIYLGIPIEGYFDGNNVLVNEKGERYGK